MTSAQARWAADPNAEAIEAWDGPLFERFARFRHLVTTGLGAHGDAAMRRADPQPGERVLDVGCGFGDTTQRLAGIVGSGGEAVGIDASPRFIEASIEDARQEGVENVRFHVADAQADDLGSGFDLAFSRMGTMFFAAPVPAMRNICGALRPGGRLSMVVWRRRIDNDWLYRAQTIVEQIVERPEEHDEPTCGPGPFSMADADTTSEILVHAGFRDIALERCDIPIQIGRDMDEALEFVKAIGPAGELLRLAGDGAKHLHGTVDAALREGLAEYDGPEGVRCPASTWVVTATAPA